MEASQDRVDVGRVFGETFEVYRENFGPLLGAAIVVFGISGLIGGLLATAGSVLLSLVGTLVSFIANALYTGFVVHLVQDVRDGRRDHSVGDLFSAAAPAVPTLIIAGILFAIAVTIGFILLIVPGLILITIWAVIAPVIVIERAGALESFGRSRQLVKGDGWSVFAVLLLAYLLLVAAVLLLSGIGTAIADDGGQVVLNIVATVLAAPVVALVVSVLYFDLGGGGAPAAPATETAPQPAEIPPPGTPPAA